MRNLIFPSHSQQGTLNKKPQHFKLFSKLIGREAEPLYVVLRARLVGDRVHHHPPAPHYVLFARRYPSLGAVAVLGHLVFAVEICVSLLQVKQGFLCKN